MAHPGRAIDSCFVGAAFAVLSGGSTGFRAVGFGEASRRVDARVAEAGRKKSSFSSTLCSARAEATGSSGLAGVLRFAFEQPVARPTAKVKIKHPPDPRIVSCDMTFNRATGVPCPTCASPRKMR
jgi:hypothetical protein